MRVVPPHTEPTPSATLSGATITRNDHCLLPVCGARAVASGSRFHSSPTGMPSRPMRASRMIPECGSRMPCSRSGRVKRGLASRAELMPSRSVIPAR
jgi:hypothetical protein